MNKKKGRAIGETRGKSVDADNLASTRLLGAHNRGDTDPAETEHGHRRVWSHRSVVDGRSIAGAETAPEKTHTVERSTLVNLGTLKRLKRRRKIRSSD